MKRMVALCASVSLSVLTTLAADAVAQYTPPPPPPRSQQPAEASNDSLKTETQQPPPAQTQTPPATQAQPDTLTAAARIRRAETEKMTYAISLGLGTSFNQDPQAFADEYDPSLGFYVGGGVRRWGGELSLSFDYNFFLTNRQKPEDMNVFNLFLNLKFLPLKTTARPYVVGSIGWFRSWIVDPLDPEDPPQTVAHEVEGGDNDYGENVLGYGVGAGVEIEIDKTRRIFFEARYVQGQTRETQNAENMLIIPVRIGLTWEM
jgi:opacity protein-like surface antigen